MQPRVTTCSFCGKRNTETGPHAEGPNDVYICEDCAYIALGICRDERRKAAGRKDHDPPRDPGRSA